MSRVITSSALKRLEGIHQLSKRYNGPSRQKHLRKLLSLVKEHSREIDMLFCKKDSHYLIETGDLLVLCLEILLEEKRNIHQAAEQCFGRYEKKLKTLIVQNGNKS